MDTKRQPKGIPVGGQYAENSHDEAGSVLTTTGSHALDLASQPLSDAELMDMANDDPQRYEAWDAHDAALSVELRSPEGNTENPGVALHSAITNPSVDQKTAISRIESLWEQPTRRARSESIISDMRRSGALTGSPEAREVYARALVLSESGDARDAEVEHLIDHIENGGTDYIVQARSFGYPPEQYIHDLASAQAAAAYREVNASDTDVEYAAEFRRKTLKVIAEDAGSRLNRSWSSRDEDAEDIRRRIEDLSSLEDQAEDENSRLRRAAKKSAYEYALHLIEGGGTR